MRWLPRGVTTIAAVVAALSETGSPTLDDSLEAALRVNGYCRDRGGMRGQYYDALSLEADRLLDGTSAARLSNRPAKVSVAVTQFKPLPAPLLASSFTDQDDVKQALLATSCIPFYFKGARPFVTFRGAPAVDGFFAVKRSNFGAPETEVRRTIRVCPFPAATKCTLQNHGNALKQIEYQQLWPRGLQLASHEALLSRRVCIKNSLTCILKINVSEFGAKFENARNAFGTTHSDSERNSHPYFWFALLRKSEESIYNFHSKWILRRCKIARIFDTATS